MLCRGWISIIECPTSHTPIRSSCRSACGRIREWASRIRCFHEWVCQVYSVYLLYWYKSTDTDAAHPLLDARVQQLSDRRRELRY